MESHKLEARQVWAWWRLCGWRGEARLEGDWEADAGGWPLERGLLAEVAGQLWDWSLPGKGHRTGVGRVLS